MKTIGIIPARYESSRLRGKPLADINGKTLIQRVYERCSKAQNLSAVYVATDDERIFQHVISFGGNAIMTSTLHRSGTERCCEALCKLENEGQTIDFVINIQGDEPFIQPELIEELAANITKGQHPISTAAKSASSSEDFINPSVVKVVVNLNNVALYFSRSPIPFYRDSKSQDFRYLKHIGIYAYTSDILKKITKLEETKLEKAEMLEQLRWLENNINVGVVITNADSFISVDTPDDLEKARKYAIEHKL